MLLALNMGSHSYNSFDEQLSQLPDEVWAGHMQVADNGELKPIPAHMWPHPTLATTSATTHRLQLHQLYQQGTHVLQPVLRRNKHAIRQCPRRTRKYSVTPTLDALYRCGWTVASGISVHMKLSRSPARGFL